MEVVTADGEVPDFDRDPTDGTPLMGPQLDGAPPDGTPLTAPHPFALANQVARTLQSLAKEGRTIVCTIHSPTAYAFSLFDALLMLKTGEARSSNPLAAPFSCAALADCC